MASTARYAGAIVATTALARALAAHHGSAGFAVVFSATLAVALAALPAALVLPGRILR